MDDVLVTISLKNVVTITLIGLIGLALWSGISRWLKSRDA